MTPQSKNLATIRSDHPVATELAAVVAVLVGLSLWQYVAREFVLPSIGFGPGGVRFEAVDSLLVAGAVTGTVLLVGVAAVVGAYVRLRSVETGVALPSSERLPSVVVAVLAPVALVGVTKLVATVTGITYSSLMLRSYGTGAALGHFVSMTALILFVSVPVLLVVCQVLVQGSFRRVVDDDVAVGLTTLVAGFLLVDPDGGTLNALPDPLVVVGGVLFVVALSVVLFVRERVDREWLRHLSVVPVALIVAVTVLSALAAIGTVAAGLFVASQFVVLGVAAHVYNRTGSLLVPSLTYASFLASSEAVVFFLEAGVQNW